MLLELAASPQTSVKMLAVIAQRDVVSGCHTNNTEKYLWLMIAKTALDAVVLHLCCRKLYTSFLNMCSLSIVLADLVMLFLMATMWFLGSDRYLVSLCYLLSNASATYAALPLPMMCLGLLDYCLQGVCKQSAFCKFLRNAALTLLVWILAGVYAFSSVNSDLMELDYETGITALVCEVGESTLITYLVLGLFLTVIFTVVPFWSMIPQWLKEAERLSEEREERGNHSSDLIFTETKSGEDYHLEEMVQQRPPLWLSLTLGFGLFWMPFLTVSVACVVLSFGVPAYITVNLLWLECTNSFLMGVVFWANSRTQGPYSLLPENVCLWHVYWHLSKETKQQQLPVVVFNPSKEKRNSLLYL